MASQSSSHTGLLWSDTERKDQSQTKEEMFILAIQYVSFFKKRKETYGHTSFYTIKVGWKLTLKMIADKNKNMATSQKTRDQIIKY